MALFPCNIGSSGGMSETTLWSNSAPTSAFNDTDVTLSQSIQNFDFVKITVRLTSNNATQYSTLISVEDFDKASGTTQTRPSFGIDCGIYESGSMSWYARTLYKNSDTSISISKAIKRGTGSSVNTYVIPITIYGVK